MPCCCLCTHTATGKPLDPSYEEIAMYYARLIGYLKNGHMTDERGTVHRMPAGLAIGETVILLHPPLPLVGVSIETMR